MTLRNLVYITFIVHVTNSNVLHLFNKIIAIWSMIFHGCLDTSTKVFNNTEKYLHCLVVHRLNTDSSIIFYLQNKN